MSAGWKEVDDLELLQLEAEMHDELEDLRTAAKVYADRAWARTAPNDGSHNVRSSGKQAVFGLALAQQWKAWTIAGVAAAALAVGVRIAHRNGPETLSASPAAVQVHPDSATSDEALLQQIHSDISSGVPVAMEPLEASGAKPAQGTVRQ